MPSGGADSRIAATAVGAAIVSTPEHRDGRKRSPHRGNTIVSWPAVAPLPAYDPMEGSDPWKQYASQRGPTVHSGMSPQLIHERQTLEAFLADTFAPSLPPIPTPAPIQVQQADSATVFQAILDGQAALLQGVNELRANAVTKQHLQTFHALQSQEMRTYVQAELAPVHAGFKEFGTNMGKFSDRLDRIESGANSIGNESAGSDTRGPAFRRVVFIGFPSRYQSHNVSKQLWVSCKNILPTFVSLHTCSLIKTGCPPSMVTLKFTIRRSHAASQIQ